MSGATRSRPSIEIPEAKGESALAPMTDLSPHAPLRSSNATPASNSNSSTNDTTLLLTPTSSTTAAFLANYAQGLTPISSLTPSSQDPNMPGKGKGKKRRKFIKKKGTSTATTSKPRKSTIIPRELLDAFDKRSVKSTRGNDIDMESKQQEVLIAHSPSLMSPEQRRLVIKSAQSVSPSALQSFLRMSKHSFKNLLRRSPIIGRPPTIDPFHVERVCDAVKDAEQSKRALTREEVYQRLRNASERTAQEKHLPLPDKVGFESKLYRAATGAGIQFKMGQATTEARWLAERDIRNMVSMASRRRPSQNSSILWWLARITRRR